MDFELPEELKMVQGMVRDFVQEKLRPLEREILGRAADLSDARLNLSPEKEAELVGIVREMGLWGVGVPENLGGAGLDTLGMCIVEEELARTAVPFHFGDVSPVLFECNEAQKQRFLRPALDGKKTPYLALVEPGECSERLELKMRAEPVEGGYVLRGRKLSFSRPGSDYFAIVFAGTEAGPTCFLVDQETAGFSLWGDEERSGWRAGRREPLLLVFDECRLAAEDILGEPGRAFFLGRQWLPRRRVVRAARCVGAASRLLEEAALQAGSLENFGQPVHRRPGVEAALADIAGAVHAGRLLVYEAAWKADRDKLTRSEAALVRWQTLQMLNTAADRIAHIFHGPPYIEGLPMERLCLRLKENCVTHFSLAGQRHLIARDILTTLKGQ